MVYSYLSILAVSVYVLSLFVFTVKVDFLNFEIYVFIFYLLFWTPACFFSLQISQWILRLSLLIDLWHQSHISYLFLFFFLVRLLSEILLFFYITCFLAFYLIYFSFLFNRLRSARPYSPRLSNSSLEILGARRTFVLRTYFLIVLKC